jgi:hypothetical protein
VQQVGASHLDALEQLAAAFQAWRAGDSSMTDTTKGAALPADADTAAAEATAWAENIARRVVPNSDAVSLTTATRIALEARLDLAPAAAPAGQVQPPSPQEAAVAAPTDLQQPDAEQLDARNDKRDHGKEPVMPAEHAEKLEDALKRQRTAATPHDFMMSAAYDVLVERHKQRARWGDEHDDEHGPNKLATEACGYLLPGQSPMRHDWSHQSKVIDRDPRRVQLVKGVALALAALEAHDRAAKAGRDR